MIKNYLITIAVLFIYTTTIVWASETDIEVRIKNIQFQQGKIMVSICQTEEQYDQKNCKYRKSLDSKKLSVSLPFSNIQSKQVVVMVFQDLNSNGILDTNFIGIPNEPIGFSNNPKVKFGSPDYEEVVHSLNQGDRNIIDIILIDEAN